MDVFLSVYLLAVCYSLICAPGLFFDIFDDARDTPEWFLLFLACCLFFSVTLLGAAHRIYHLAKGE